MHESREKFLNRHLGKLAEEVFPDDVDIQWDILGFGHKSDLTVVEAEPPKDSMGYEKFKLVVSFERGDRPAIVATYAYDAGRYFLLSAINGYKDELPKKGAQRTPGAPALSEPAKQTGSASSRVGIWFEGFMSTVSPLVLATILLITWISPMSIENGSWVRLVVGIMALEFIMIHSGVLLSSVAMIKDMKGRGWLYGGLALVYTLFVLAITISFKSWYFMIVYSAIMFARWQSMIKGENNFNESMVRSGASIFNLVVTTLVVWIVPIPRLGVTDRVLSLHPIEATGGWIDHPENALATGVIYFALMAVYEWLAMKYKLRRASEGRPAVLTTSSTSVA